MVIVTDLVRLAFHALFIALAVVGEIPWWVPTALVLNDLRYPVSINWPPWRRQPVCPAYPHYHGKDGEVIPMIRPEDLLPPAQIDPWDIPINRKPTVH